jgi:TolB-like protein
VLPLDNYSGDPSQEYFAEGMTDELTAQLATISRLRVISRGSAMQFKGEHRPPTPEIAKTLDVDAVVEGSVLRAGDKVRITAQLIDARADRHLWARSFERSSRDVLALQGELASAIAREIHVQLTPAEQSGWRAPSVNPSLRRLPEGPLLLQPPERREPQGDRTFRSDRAQPGLRPRALGAVGRLPLGRLQRGIPDRLGGEAQGEGRR